MSETYYDLLGVPREADPATLREGYRREAMKWHPDKNGGSRQSTERFKGISEAYAVLSDPMRRSAYDQALTSGQEAAFAGQQNIDPQAAAYMFLQEMASLAAELSMQNTRISDIAAALMAKGCPRDVATSLAHGMTAQRKSLVRAAAGRSFLGAAAFIVIGLIVLAVSGGYLITTGLFFVGAINLVRALYRLASGRVPSQKT